jgi:hypothetical protein
VTAPASIPALIAEGRRLIAEATLRPWRANLYLGGAHAIDRIAPNGDTLGRVAVVDGLVETKANAALIVLAVNALPALLDVAEAGDALLGYHDRCGVASGYGDALRSALSRLRGVRS